MSGEGDALHAAVRSKDTSTVVSLLTSGTPVDATDKHQRTALHLAAWSGDAEVSTFVLPISFAFLSLSSLTSDPIYHPLCR